MQANSYRLLLIVAVSLYTHYLVGQAPTLTTTNADTISYVEGSGSKLLDESIVASSSANNSRFDGGHVRFLANYKADEDSLFIQGTNPPVSYNWDDVNGTMTFTAKNGEIAYQTAFRSVRYLNKSNHPDVSIREIEFSVTDKNGSVTLKKLIKIQAVNDAPWMYLDESSNQKDTLNYATAKGTALEICPDIFDVEGDDYSLSITGIANASGEAAVSSNAQCLTYTPESDFTGTEYLSIDIADANNSSVSNTAVLQVFVSDVPEVSNVNLDLSYVENDGLKAIHPDLTILYSNQELTSATVKISSNYKSSEDTLVYNGEETSISKTWDDNSGQLTLTGTVNKDTYREVLRNIKYQNKSENPDTETRTISVQVSDGSLESSIITSSISIESVNDAPYVYTDSENARSDTINYTTNEDEILKFCPKISDVESDDYNVELVTTDDFLSTVSLEDFCVNFTPASNITDAQYFSLKVSDKNDSSLFTSTIVEVNINPVNDAPWIVDNGVAVDTVYYGIDINQTVEICLEAEDIESDEVSLSSVPGPYAFGNVSGISGLCFSYTPNLDEVGDEYLKAIVCDNATNSLCDTVIVHVQIPGTNTAPEFSISDSDTVIRGVLVMSQLQETLQVLNRERDELVLDTAYLATQSGTLEVEVSENVAYTYKPEPSDSIINNAIFLKVCDGRSPSLCDEIVIDISINYSPEMIDTMGLSLDTLSFSMLENTQFDTCFTLVDLNNQSIFYSSIQSNRNGVLNANIDNQTNDICFSYNPEADFVGTEEFILSLCDNGDPEGCTVIVIDFAVYDTNTSPIFIYEADSSLQDFSFSFNENDSLTEVISLYDMENDLLAIDTVIGLPAGLSITIEGDSLMLDYQPPENIWGNYQTTVIVCDNNPFHLCSELGLNFDVLPVNAAPLVNTDSVEIFSSELVSVNVLANDLDPENEGLFISEFIAQSLNLGVVSLGDTSIFYTPDPDEYKGSDVISYTVCDGGIPQACVETTLTIVFSLPVPELSIYEAFSPNGDGINDRWFVEGIREYPQNQVTILDQYNNIVFQVSGYDNRENVWTGEIGKPGSTELLENDTYYYVIDLGDGQEALTGYIVLRR